MYLKIRISRCLIAFSKDENESQAAEKIHSVFSPDTAEVNHAKFWFRRICSVNVEIKAPVVENIRKIMEIFRFDRHASTVAFAQKSLQPFK